MSTQAVLNSRNAEACGNILWKRSDDSSLLSQFGSVTLPGVIELFSIASKSEHAAQLRREIRRVAQSGIAPWNFLIDAWNLDSGLGKKVLTAQPFEFRRISPPAGDDEGLQSSAFEQRFLASVSKAGFGSDFAKGIALVFHELMDNVLQHSCVGQEAAKAIAGYHVGRNYFSLGVSDMGDGFLASLSNSGNWSLLADEESAVLAVIKKGASRREGQGEGEGFKELFKVLVDKGSLVRIRSRNVVATVKPTGEGRRTETHSIADTPGAHISICCRLGSATEENFTDFAC